jgi:3-deoxy-D-manno-octulosonate 8-phosphate phosphatase (KDO 8-P phosphatase)
MNHDIRLLILDVDGVLTDGKIWYSDDGQEHKAFHTQDGLGLKRLREMGVEIAVISGRKSKCVEQRMRELGITHVFQGISDKLTVMNTLLSHLKITPNTVASIGDDLPDIPVMKNSLWAIAVDNAVPDVKAIADYCTKRSGGEGAVREACDWIYAQLGRRNDTTTARETTNDGIST